MKSGRCLFGFGINQSAMDGEHSLWRDDPSFVSAADAPLKICDRLIRNGLVRN
jgi:hypothetical protein